MGYQSLYKLIQGVPQVYSPDIAMTDAMIDHIDQQLLQQVSSKNNIGILGNFLNYKFFIST